MKPHIEEAWRALRLADRDISKDEVYLWMTETRQWAENLVVAAEDDAVP